MHISTSRQGSSGESGTMLGHTGLGIHNNTSVFIRQLSSIVQCVESAAGLRLNCENSKQLCGRTLFPLSVPSSFPLRMVDISPASDGYSILIFQTVFQPFSLK